MVGSVWRKDEVAAWEAANNRVRTFVNHTHPGGADWVPGGSYGHALVFADICSNGSALDVLRMSGGNHHFPRGEFK